MYQIEVKRWLIEHHFSPGKGWAVSVDIDAMERGLGGQQSPEKRRRAEAAIRSVQALGGAIGPNREFGRVDIVARHKKQGTFILEVEGESSKPKGQAIYSALGQLIFKMQDHRVSTGIAVPDAAEWREQIQRIPGHIKKALNLSFFLVSENGAIET